MDGFAIKLKWEGQIVGIDRVMNENDLKYYFKAKTITFKNMVVGRKDEDNRFWALQKINFIINGVFQRNLG
jgi:hypothetical protein